MDEKEFDIYDDLDVYEDSEQHQVKLIIIFTSILLVLFSIFYTKIFINNDYN